MKINIKQIARLNVYTTSKVRIDVTMLDGVCYAIICANEKERDTLFTTFSKDMENVVYAQK